MAALRFGLNVVLAVTCVAATSVFAHAQTRLETRGDQSPAVIAGRDATVNIGISPAQVAELVRAASEGATGPLARQIDDLRGRLGITEGAALAMLRSLGQADVPTERLPQALGEFAERHRDLLERLRRLDAGDPEVARLREQARSAVERGDYDGADRLLQDAEATDLAAEQRMKENLEVRRLTRAETLAQRAALAELRFRYSAAGRLYQEVASLVPDGMSSLRAGVLNLAAVALWRGGEYAEAEPLSRRALALYERVLGSEHLDVAISINILALMLSDLGRAAKAEPLQRRAIALHERALGPDNPLVATSLNNLAGILVDLSRAAEAEPLQRRALVLHERALGPNHPLVGTSTHNLGAVLRRLGRAAEAEPLHRRALALRERVLGPDHPDVATSADGLAVTLVNLNRAAEAEPLHRRALALRERVLGPDHPDVATSAYFLAEALRALGRVAEAEPLHRRTLALRERVLGPDHPDVATSADGLAVTLVNLGRAAEAEPLHRRALVIRERALGPEHPLTRSARESLARLHPISSPVSTAGADEATAASRVPSERSPASSP